MNEINRLYGSRCYIVGPIDRAEDNGIKWRKDLTPFLRSFGIVVLDPLNKPINKALEDSRHRKLRTQLKKDENYDDFSKIMKEIRNIDLRLTDIADFIIVNLDLLIHTCGTYEEIFLSNREKKPILIHCPQGKSSIPDWLYGVLPHQMFFNNWKELKDYIIYVDSSPSPETYDRWVFFSWSSLVV